VFTIGKSRYTIPVDGDMRPVIEAFVQYERTDAASRANRNWLVFAAVVGLSAMAAGSMSVGNAALLVFFSLFQYSMERWALSQNERTVAIRLDTFKKCGGTVTTIEE